MRLADSSIVSEARPWSAGIPARQTAKHAQRFRASRSGGQGCPRSTQGLLIRCVINFRQFFRPNRLQQSVRDNEDSSINKTRSRRVTPWLLGASVLMMLALIASQQLFNIAPVLSPDTASDTLLLVALSSL